MAAFLETGVQELQKEEQAASDDSEEDAGNGLLDHVVEMIGLQHKELLERLNKQDAMLQRLTDRPLVSFQRNLARPLRPPRASRQSDVTTSLVPLEDLDSTFAGGSPYATASNKSKSSPFATASNNTASNVSSAMLQPSPTVFVSYYQADLEHKEQALQVGASSSRRQFASPASSPSAGKPLPTFWQNVVQQPSFEVFFGVVVIINAVFIGFDVQHGLRTSATSPVYPALQYCFTALFTFELLARLVAFGLRLFCSADAMWCILDVIIVLSSLWDVGVDIAEVVQPEAGDVAGITGLSSLKAFRVIRISRMVKLLRLVRIFRFVMALRTLVTSIFHTLKSLFWALLLLVLIVYVFGIIFVQAVDEYIADPINEPVSESLLIARERFFGSLPDTMLSLYMSILGGVSWEEVEAPLKRISPLWLFMFLFYISFSYLAVLNVVTGVFCQSAIESAQSDHAAVVQSILANKEAHLEKIRELFGKLGDDDGIITYTAFEEKISSQEVREYFESLGLDVWDAWTFFKLLDSDSGGAVETEEFLMGCLRLRGPARAMELAKIIQDQTWVIKNLGMLGEYMESEIGLLRKDLTKIVNGRAL